MFLKGLPQPRRVLFVEQPPLQAPQKPQQSRSPEKAVNKASDAAQKAIELNASLTEKLGIKTVKASVKCIGSVIRDGINWVSSHFSARFLQWVFAVSHGFVWFFAVKLTLL